MKTNTIILNKKVYFNNLGQVFFTKRLVTNKFKNFYEYLRKIKIF